MVQQEKARIYASGQQFVSSEVTLWFHGNVFAPMWDTCEMLDLVSWT